MPYLEDGETWDARYGGHARGMAENRPGHRGLTEYDLPGWVKHPIAHPSSGVSAGPEDYRYACSRGLLDGLTNQLGRGPAHVACMFGDMAMLQSCSEGELSAQTVNGETPAYYAVRYGTAWCLQWLVERGADVTTAAADGFTPEQLIWANNRNHNVEMEWLHAALRGQLTEKKSQQSQEYRLRRWRPEGLDPFSEGFLDQAMARQRMWMYKSGDFEMPYDVPSPAEAAAKMDLPRSTVARPPGRPPAPAALLFPGQGSQYVGMMRELLGLPAVQCMLRSAREFLGWDVREMALRGPEAQLAEIRHSQPCVLVADLAGLELLRRARPEVAERPQAVAGLGVGEYAALCAAGVLSFEDSLRLVTVRAEAAQAAQARVPQRTCSVAGLDRAALEGLCREAAASHGGPGAVCQISQSLFPLGFACAGSADAVEALGQLAAGAGALQAKAIEAGGALHTPLAAEAAAALAAAIDDLLPRMRPPSCDVYFNATGSRVLAGTPPREFVGLLRRQAVEEVQWEALVRAMIADQVRSFYEVGPLKQLKAMMKRIDADAFKRTECIPV